MLLYATDGRLRGMKTRRRLGVIIFAGCNSFCARILLLRFAYYEISFFCTLKTFVYDYLNLECRP